MKFLKSKFVRVIALFILVGFLAVRTGFLDMFLSPKAAYAVGDLTVTWQDLGSGSVGPLFSVSGMIPGDEAAKTVTIQNDSGTTRPINIKADATTPGILSDVLEVTISESGTDVYGGTTGFKNLTDFFNDSGAGDGVSLGNLSSSQSKTFTIHVLFQPSAGNEYQNQSVVFNLIIGIAIDIPEACSEIEDLDILNPIYGTSKSEIIKGTDGNDLIFALEGSDIVDGKKGDDCIIGGKGSDALKGGEGNDVIYGNEGSDSLEGGSGNDVMYGGDGNDSIKGGGGNDTGYGENGSDSLDGNGGDDILVGGPGSDAANGGNGSDSCSAEAKNSCEISI